MAKVRAELARAIAEGLVATLEPVCDRVLIAGSLRRQCFLVGDIELLVIPKYDGLVDLLEAKVQELIAEGVLDYRRNKLGSKVYGLQNKLLVHRSGIGVDVFSTDEHCWAVALARGMRFHAYGSGFTLPDGSHWHCGSEEEVFRAVGLRYQAPWERK